jgi:hypothetical protein
LASVQTAKSLYITVLMALNPKVAKQFEIKTGNKNKKFLRNKN